MTKQFLRHEACPKCGSADNVGVWSDGQKWCFGGCGYHVKGDGSASITELRQRLDFIEQQEENSQNGNTGIVLPSDFTSTLPSEPTAWLTRYGITKAERILHRFGWSERYESLILPVYDIHNNLLLVQRRYFGQGKWPKYHTKGQPEKIVHVVGEFDGETGVLVEDLISAIKVGRHIDAVPLFGSHLSLEKIRQLSHRFGELVLWLDRDKAKDAVKYKWRAAPFFRKVSIIVQTKDPKEYSDEQLQQILEPHLVVL